MSEFFPKDCKCNVCEELVVYGTGTNVNRRRCSVCKNWCHATCALMNGVAKSNNRATCFNCIQNNGPTLGQLEWSAEVLSSGLSRDKELRSAALVTLACIWVHSEGNPAKHDMSVAEITKLPVEEVSMLVRNLQHSIFWRAGKFSIKGGDELFDRNDPAQCNVMLLRAIFCTAGETKRKSSKKTAMLDESIGI